MKKEEKPEVETLRNCFMCGIELNHGQFHVSEKHCIKDLHERVVFLRNVTQGQAKELDWIRTAINATHRMAYILLEHFTENGRVTLPRKAFEAVDAGAGVTLTESIEGDFEVVAVVPKKEEAAS